MKKKVPMEIIKENFPERAKPTPKKPVFSEHSEDWCHICGKRRKGPLVDIWGISAPDLDYLRICVQCVSKMAAITN